VIFLNLPGNKKEKDDELPLKESIRSHCIVDHMWYNIITLAEREKPTPGFLLDSPLRAEKRVPPAFFFHMIKKEIGCRVRPSFCCYLFGKV
jgi:hypothetical protein